MVKILNRIGLLSFCLAALFLSGCATYKIEKGKGDFSTGYVASREGYTIVEDTVGRENKVPEELTLAKERLKRRRSKVEDYYKRMGYISNRFNEAVWEPIREFVYFVTGPFRLPFIATRDYHARHDPAYKEKLRKIDEENEAKEEARINKLKEQLKEYVNQDLAREESKMGVKPVEPAAVPEVKLEPLELPKPAVEAPVEVKEQKEDVQEMALKQVSAEPDIIITARPPKGFSPLKVQFTGTQSRAYKAKIVSYSWDFGDGETSGKPNPSNTYWSGSFEPKVFTATLTATDNQGRTSSSSVDITVMNK